MRVYTHVHPHTLPPLSKNTEHTLKTPISTSVKNNLPHQATSAHRLSELPHPRPRTPMNKLRIHERMCTPCSECVRRCVGRLTTARSRKPSKSRLTPALDAVAAGVVAQASSDHPRWCGPKFSGLWLAPAVRHRYYPFKDVSSIFSRT